MLTQSGAGHGNPFKQQSQCTALDPECQENTQDMLKKEVDRLFTKCWSSG